MIARVSADGSRALLDRALRSVAPLTDACVVVLDDRSHPDAAAELRALGATVVLRAWTDDFAAARNAVHEHTTAPWLLVIDADEVLADPGNLAARIARAEHEGHDGLLCRVDTVGDDGPGETLPQIRVYRREACTWRYRVHNELVGARTLVPSSARFVASYVGTIAEKAARSLPLLLAEAEAHPEEPRWAHFLAQTYHATGETAEMVRWAERCVALAPDEEVYVHRWCDLALARFAASERRGAGLSTILEAVERHPSHPDGWHTLATIALAEWHRAAISGRTLTPVRTGRYAPALAETAPALGLPLAARGPRAPSAQAKPEPRREEAAEAAEPAGAPRAPSARAVDAVGDRLRIAFVCAAGTRFLTGIEDALEARHDVRRLHFTEQVSLRVLGEAMEWADVVWFEWCDELVVEASRRLRKRARVVCRLHRYEVFTDLPSRVRWDFVDRLVFVSEPTRRIFEARFDARPACAVIPNAIDTERLRLSTDGDPFALAYLGYLNAKKSPELLLQCMAELVRRDPRYHLHVAGTFQDPIYELYFDKMLPALGLTDHVTMHGWIDDVDAWLHDKSFLVSTSVSESFGVGIAEGMAKGLTPVIHDWVGAEEIWPRELAFRTVAGFADRVQRGRDDPAALRAWVVERYDRHEVVRRIEALLVGLAAREGESDG